MGKNLISQRRGKGSVYKAPSFRYAGVVRYPPSTDKEKSDVVNGRVVDLVHSTGHYAPIANITYEDRRKAQEIAPQGMFVGQRVSSGTNADVKDGNVLPLSSIPDGTLIFNIESLPGDGGKFVRTSGGFARVLSKSSKNVTVLLPSKKEHSFNVACRATIGIVAGGGRTEKPMLKAGLMRRKKYARGKLYPSVSGVSMNAVAHPFGGGGSHKGRPTIARKHAPPGAKVGMLRPSKSGRGKGRRK